MKNGYFTNDRWQVQGAAGRFGSMQGRMRGKWCGVNLPLGVGGGGEEWFTA